MKVIDLIAGRFYRPFVVLSLLAILIYGMFNNAVRDTRLYRDVTYRTPFRGVEIDEVTVDAASLTVAGTFFKTRDCVIVPGSLRAFVMPTEPAVLTEAEIDRTGTPIPPANARFPFTFVITAPPGVTPTEARTFVSHWCPGEDRPQTNRFFRVIWRAQP